MTPKSFVLDLILTPLNQYPVLGCVSDVLPDSLMNRLNQTDKFKRQSFLKESLHNQKLHRVLFVRVILLDYILGAFVKSRAT